MDRYISLPKLFELGILPASGCREIYRSGKAQLKTWLTDLCEVKKLEYAQFGRI